MYSSLGVRAWERVLVLKLKHGSICLFDTWSFCYVISPAREHESKTMGLSPGSPSHAGKMDESTGHGHVE